MKPIEFTLAPTLVIATSQTIEDLLKKVRTFHLHSASFKL